jgi:Tol biopolymer transport system component
MPTAVVSPFSWRTVGMATLVVLALVAVGLIAGGREQPRLQPVVGPAGNGLVAYSSDGDIFTGNLVTGISTAIVTGPSNDTRPIFSPDGLRIAFVRAKSLSEMSIVVIRSDGSDERVVVEEGFSAAIGPFAWTPDSTSIVVNHDSPTRGTPYFDGELSLFDPSGLAGPRLITPPLPAQIGYTYFTGRAEVAPMFRPPRGDRLLSVQTGATEVLSVLDIDGTNVDEFGLPSLAELEPYVFERPDWSADGSMIAFGLGGRQSGLFEALGLFVMNADGSDLRRFEPESTYRATTPTTHRAWSPDGSKIAFEKGVTVSGNAGMVIAIVDVKSGAERDFDATFAVMKDRASHTTDPGAFQTYSIRTDHEYAYEGWSWTPDGRSIVVLERHGTRPMVVDIETGLATELPWTSESAPSWQRIAVD